MQPHERQLGIGGIAIFVIIALIAAIGGSFVYFMGRSNVSTTVENNPSPTESTVVVTTVAPTSAAVGDATDAGLDKASADVTTKLNALNQDSTNIDTGLNDQQGNLSEN